MVVTEGRHIVVVLVTMVVSAMMSSITTGPKNQVKNVGESVVFTCVTPFEKCSGIEWLKREEQKVPVSMYKHGQGKRNPEVFGNTQYSVDETTDGCPLTISNLRLIDSGGYLCSIIHERTEYRKFGALLVVDPSKKQCHSSFERNEVYENDVFNMTCSIAMRPDLVGFARDSLLWFNKIVIMKSDITRASDVLSSQYSSVAKANDTLEFTCKVFIQPDSDPTYDQDQTNATLEVCKLPKKTVFFGVRNIWFSLSKTTFYERDEIECKADGHPSPTIKWRNMNTGKEFKSPNLTFDETIASNGDVFNCTASNTVKDIHYEVYLTGTYYGGANSGWIIIVVVICIIIVVVGGVVVILVFVRVEGRPLYRKILNGRSNSERQDAEHPLTTQKQPPPEKPPRASSQDRPQSEVHYAQLATDNNPHLRPSKPATSSSTIYVPIRNA